MIITAPVRGFEKFIHQKGVRIGAGEFMEFRPAAGQLLVDHAMQKISRYKSIDEGIHWADHRRTIAALLMEGELDDIRIGEQLTIDKEIHALFEVFFRFIIGEGDEKLNQGRECGVSDRSRGFIFPSVIVISIHFFPPFFASSRIPDAIWDRYPALINYFR
jgi:hypothetical protein